MRQAARDLAKSEERTQKLKEAQKAQEFSVKMMESQLKELSNDHVRRMDHQVARFKKVLPPAGRTACRCIEW